MAIIITIIYCLSLLYIFLFSVGQLHLTWIFIKSKKKIKEEAPTLKHYPFVTIQLPTYNERYVIERLLESVSKINYPTDRFEIQVLDDSTDDTTRIALQKIETIKKETSIDIQLIHRKDRTGFKAGALDHGTQLAKGEFIAIFDSDFMPTADFLEKTIPHLQDGNIGAVQTRWGHVNKNYSLLTQLQAYGLDAHFSIEQSARNASGSFINFNGTCGVWRKSCIEQAGGWSAETLTEDLDLSYRAQLKGWLFKFLQNVETPGELPIIMTAVKSQQYRWNKGGAETARKNFGNVLRSKISATSKIHAFFHLFNSSVFVCLLLAAVLSIPMLYIKNANPNTAWLFNLGSIFLLGFLSIALFYWTSTKEFYKNSKLTFVKLFPQFLIISMGLSLHNGLAVVEGLLGIKTPFIRTPKFNVVSKSDSWNKNIYIKNSLSWLTIVEGLLCIYFLFGIYVGFQIHDLGLLVFHFMLALGFGAVFYFSVKPLPHA